LDLDKFLKHAILLYLVIGFFCSLRWWGFNIHGPPIGILFFPLLIVEAPIGMLILYPYIMVPVFIVAYVLLYLWKRKEEKEEKDLMRKLGLS